MWKALKTILYVPAPETQGKNKDLLRIPSNWQKVTS
jgi:hypothetical protein